MADVRSLLRNELATRKGSSQTGSTGNRVTKKRKVDPADDPMRKKIRPAGAEPNSAAGHMTIQPPSATAIEEEHEEEELEQLDEEVTGPEAPSDAPIEHDPSEPVGQPSETPAGTAPAPLSQTVDEDEWAAFEREVVAPTRMPHRPAALTATATISAAPLTAEEIAAQQQRESETISKNREVEAEGEREDAARFMENEFDEMEQLEERLKRLKQKREELRQLRPTEDIIVQDMDKSPSATPAPQDELGHAGRRHENEDEQEEEEDDDDDDDDDDEDEDDDDWDNWRFR
ncbi:hypothetical protein ASPACDRAFT_1853220 [Aspergillus aculeatus ATCC 16872]|uniref:Uncharacterized protein n=1 Tax=Aspergillus aculeatus (strain ATCC 16872 / CBS 172.66 / WB 5094) TaxID=690307 RepID=A0A1L9X2F0_ASPA1|nr:uncharacterized protein ASPACDRAFT_1853220 [Aspergillus aculeatus ATCC 16872]OJK02643.1 hypothetical protein ASPACDRAFT_1853220 [Aspergillus aculeatus ATCC 16872]